MPKVDLRTKPIAITGASAGIGWHTALACAAAGMPVALGARREDRLHELAGLIRAAGGRAIARRCDVTSPDDCRALVEAATAEFGSLYAAFANAGYGIEGDVLETPDQAWRDIIETNFFGSLHLLRPAATHMLARGEGHLLLCSSVVSKLGIPTMAAYSASKAMQDHAGRALRIELAGRLFVSTVHPIGTDTEFSRVVQDKAGGRARTARAPEMTRQRPEQVARAIVACLRRPRGEVWTSWPARMIAAFAAAAPEFADSILRRKFPRPAPPPAPNPEPPTRVRA